MEKMREEFDKYFSCRVKEMKERGLTDSYIRIQEEAAFEIWQASREAIEIVLPEKGIIEDENIPDLCDWDMGRNTGIEECEKVIRAAGLKVRSE